MEFDFFLGVVSSSSDESACMQKTSVICKEILYIHVHMYMYICIYMYIIYVYVRVSSVKWYMLALIRDVGSYVWYSYDMLVLFPGAHALNEQKGIL